MSVVFSESSGFLRHDIAEILLKVVLNTIKQTTNLFEGIDLHDMHLVSANFSYFP
jgi:hypothetical protein